MQILKRIEKFKQTADEITKDIPNAKMNITDEIDYERINLFLFDTILYPRIYSIVSFTYDHIENDFKGCIDRLYVLFKDFYNAQKCANILKVEKILQKFFMENSENTNVSL